MQYYCGYLLISQLVNSEGLGILNFGLGTWDLGLGALDFELP
jgi:hypothetical protein